MPLNGGVHEKPNDKCVKMCRRYVGSAIWRRFVKKNPGKSYREKTTGGGGCNNPLGCIRVKKLITLYSVYLYFGGVLQIVY